MTLIEVLVALLLLSVLSAGMLSALRTGHRAYASVLRAGQGISDVALTQRFLRRTIESASPVGAANAKKLERFAFDGTHETLTLSAPMSQASGAQGLYRYEVSLAPRTDGTSDLVVRYGVDRDGEVVGTGAGSGSDTQEEVLLERVRDIKYAYLAPPVPDRDRPRPAQWSDSWQKAGLPMLVRVSVAFDSADPRKWPEFLVAPRLTEGAQCVFDLISGTCRESP